MIFIAKEILKQIIRQGALLELFSADGAPIENVMGSVRNAGHPIREQQRIEDYWKITI